MPPAKIRLEEIWRKTELSIAKIESLALHFDLTGVSFTPSPLKSQTLRRQGCFSALLAGSLLFRFAGVCLFRNRKFLAGVVTEMQMQTASALSRPGSAPRVGIEAFFRHKKLFFWIVFATLLVAILVTILTPKQYASEMKFLIQNTRGNVPVTPERTESAGAPGDVTDTQVTFLECFLEVAAPAAAEGLELELELRI
jgi:hypothetical protein